MHLFSSGYVHVIVPSGTAPKAIERHMERNIDWVRKKRNKAAQKYTPEQLVAAWKAQSAAIREADGPLVPDDQADCDAQVTADEQHRRQPAALVIALPAPTAAGIERRGALAWRAAARLLPKRRDHVCRFAKLAAIAEHEPPLPWIDDEGTAAASASIAGWHRKLGNTAASSLWARVRGRRGRAIVPTP